MNHPYPEGTLCVLAHLPAHLKEYEGSPRITTGAPFTNQDGIFCYPTRTEQGHARRTHADRLEPV